MYTLDIKISIFHADITEKIFLRRLIKFLNKYLNKNVNIEFNSICNELNKGESENDW